MREAEKCGLLSKLISENGGTPFFYPLLTIVSEVDHRSSYIIGNIDQYDWIVFTSANSVEHFFNHLKTYGGVWPVSVKTVAVGPNTASAMDAFGISADRIPETYTGIDVAELLKKEAKNKKILFPKGSLAPQTIKKELNGIADVEEWIIYSTIEKENPDLSGCEKMDCYILMSPSAVSAFKKSASPNPEKPVFCIGPSTSQRAQREGFRCIITPNEYTQRGLFESLCHYYKEVHHT